MIIHILFVGILLLISVVHSYKKKSLTLLGAIIAFFIGMILFLSGGYTFLAAIIAFYVSSKYMTKTGRTKKIFIEENIHEKSGYRDHAQVLANGVVGALIAIIYMFYQDKDLITLLFVAYAVPNSDTWASELGVLSKKKPVSILTFKEMDPGLSGGVTLTGTIAAFLGALYMALIYGVLMLKYIVISQLLLNILIITLLGFIGCLIDSILGIMFQPLYHNKNKNLLTEKRNFGKENNLKVKGYQLFSNDIVNFLSILITTIMAYIIFYFL